VRGGGASGFTLLEVLVALAILATSLVVLLQDVGSSIRLSEISRDLAVAAMIARDKMTETEIEGKYVIGEKDGDFEDRYPGFAWHQSIAEAMFPGILQVDLTVLWGDPTAPEHLTVTSFVQATEESYSEVPPEETDDDSGTGGSPSGGSPTGGGKTSP
jgi:general secretion pathway protein I